MIPQSLAFAGIIIKERWLVHVIRMEACRISNRALNWNLSSTNRKSGRPRRNWHDIIRRDLKDIWLTWDEVSELAHYRSSWRQRVAQCVFDSGWTQVSGQAVTQQKFRRPIRFVIVNLNHTVSSSTAVERARTHLVSLWWAIYAAAAVSVVFNTNVGKAWLPISVLCWVSEWVDLYSA